MFTFLRTSKRYLAGALVAGIALATPLGMQAITAAPAHAASPTYVPVYSFHSATRGDFWTTTDPAVTGCPTCSHPPDYISPGLEGYAFNPANPQPAGTLKLYNWYNPKLGDNYMTTDSAWNGAAAGYTRFRLEGYVYATAGPGHIVLKTWWSRSFGDYATSAGAAFGQSPATNNQAPDYRLTRVQGYLAAPDLVVGAKVLGKAVPHKGGGFEVPISGYVKNAGLVSTAAWGPFRLQAGDTHGTVPTYVTAGTGIQNLVTWGATVTTPLAPGETRSFTAKAVYSYAPPTGTILQMGADSPMTAARTYWQVLESNEDNNSAYIPAV